MKKPAINEITLLAHLEHWIAAEPYVNEDALYQQCPVMLVGNRGYFRNTMGRLKINDFGIYDDAMFVVDLPRNKVYNFNANCDPVKTGFNKANNNKPYAQLCPGIWPFVRGPHKGVPGHFRQPTYYQITNSLGNAAFDDQRSGGLFTVRRLEQEKVFETEEGMFNINIHAGTKNGTSSWGCQTLPPDQFKEMRDKTYKLMDEYGQKWIPYILSEDKIA